MAARALSTALPPRAVVLAALLAACLAQSRSPSPRPAVRGPLTGISLGDITPVLTPITTTGTTFPVTLILECRGGGGTMTYTSSSKTLQWNFIRLPTVNVLAPGECVVSNRALTADEPTCLLQRGVDVFAVWPLANLANSRASSNQAPWMNTFMGFASVRQFTVRRQATGCWEVIA